MFKTQNLRALESLVSLALTFFKEYHSSRKNRILIFVLYKKEASRIEDNLKRMGWNCTSIHGDKSQQARYTKIVSYILTYKAIECVPSWPFGPIMAKQIFSVPIPPPFPKRD